MIQLKFFKAIPRTQTQADQVQQEILCSLLGLQQPGLLLHQQLTDVLKLAHVGELFLHQLLHSSTHAHRDYFQAAAEGDREKDKDECGLNYLVSYWGAILHDGCISAFTLNIHH